LQTRKSPISEPGLDLSGIEGRKRFRKEEHLKRRAELTRVFKKGRVVSCPGVKLFFLANGLPHNRIVITFVRKYGNAVQRNRARRLGREAYRLMKDKLKTGYDLVLLIYPRPAENAPHRPGLPGKSSGLPAGKAGTLAESTQQLKTLFRKAGLYAISQEE
jgi:ribonuclease P protein component